jgi:hypothetical protein
MKTNDKWYVANNSNDTQGLVISEETGENIAVTYKAENAPLIANSHNAIELLVDVLDMLNNITTEDFSHGKDFPVRDKISRFLDEINN